MDLRPKRTEFSGGGSKQATDEVIRIARVIRSVEDWETKLDDRDRAFAKDMIQKVDRQPLTLWVNSRQVDWFRDIKDKVIA